MCWSIYGNIQKKKFLNSYFSSLHILYWKKELANLIGLDITEQVTRPNSLALGLVPLDNGALAHGGGQGGHVDGGPRHRSSTSSRGG